jgi:ArsR family transcriptional regulator, arsenate/arsenite/antimonite-responsive transcriptional repressor / arsenate reductase (thioredoxin)
MIESMNVERPTADSARSDASDRGLARRTTIHAALADPHRLAIVDELALADRSPSELRTQLQIGSNLLAHHLDVLEGAGLVERLGSSGDRRRKYLRLVPDALAAIWAPVEIVTVRRLLFVCTANSARSQLAAALWNDRHEVPAESAGTKPAARVHAEAVRAAERTGLDLTHARPRSLDDVVGEPDLMITVCDRAHEHLRRAAPARSHLHWSVPDPADGGGPSAFDDALVRISARFETLAPRVARPAVVRPSPRMDPRTGQTRRTRP